jgi:CubicO group peptidase (beta-lactamase class C family)
MMDSLEAYVDALCREFDHNGPGLCVGIVKTGELVFSKGYGQAHLGYPTPIHADTVFHCCSMAKQFTAACVALLEEAGALSLDDRITDYFPRLPAYCNSIRLANLLYMTNGLYDIYDIAGCVCGVSENNAFSERQSWQYIAGTPAPMFLPGERYAYGNTGYFLLGRLVEKVSGQKLSQFACDNIFAPLKMRNTFLRDDKTKIIANIAMGYKNYSQAHGGAPDDGLCALGDRYSEFADCMEMPGAGQLWTTVNDLAKWDGNFYANQLGSQTQALISRLTTPGQLNSGASCGYGFGLFCHESHGERYVSHGGWAGGYSSNLIRNLDRKISVMALGNHVNILGSISGENGILTKNHGLLSGKARRGGRNGALRRENRTANGAFAPCGEIFRAGHLHDLEYIRGT